MAVPVLTDTLCSGLQTPQLNDEASSVLYGVFAVAGLFMGSVAVSGGTLSVRLFSISDHCRIELAWSSSVHLSRYHRLLSLYRRSLGPSDYWC